MIDVASSSRCSAARRQRGRSRRGAQQPERIRLVGVLMHATSDEPESQARIVAFAQGLQEAGWSVGRNVRIETRWSTGDASRLRRDAAELVALAPDVVLAGVGATIPALLEASRTVPVVFAQGLDPVGAGFVESLARPGGNATGFTQFEYSLSGKWLEVLKEVAPGLNRVGVLREAGPAGIGQWAIIQAVAQSSGVELSPINLRDASEIERAVTAFAGAPNGGLIVVVSASSQIHRELIISLAARHQLPVVYPYRFFVTGGGLMSYGPDLINQYRRAASYVDRILKGEKPANLPVQAQTKFELVDQPQDREGARPRRAAVAARSRRRGDRMMRRREFITLLGGAAAHGRSRRGAQQSERVRRIGVLAGLSADDAQGQARLVAFVQGLQQLGWTDGRNVRIDFRWGAGDADRFRRYAAELIALAPDVVLASGSPAVGPLLHANSYRTGRVCVRRRPGRCWLCHEPGAARRQRDRLHAVRIRHRHEMAGTAERDRTRREASGGPPGCGRCVRDRPVRCDSGPGAVARGGRRPGQRRRRK